MQPITRLHEVLGGRDPSDCVEWRRFDCERKALAYAQLTSLRWSQVDLRSGRMHVNRAKGGQEAVHPLRGPELRALRLLPASSPYVFVTKAGTPTTTAWFLRMVQRSGKAAKLPFPVTRICSAIQLAISWRTMATTPGRLRTTWAIATCNRRRDTQRRHRIGLRSSGRTSAARRCPVYRRQPSCDGAGRALFITSCYVRKAPLLLLIDLAKDRCLVVDHSLTPTQRAGHAFNLSRKGQLRPR
jgi:hypothetical protein